MKCMNRVSLIGAVGKDPEMKITDGGMTIANFSVATTKKVKETDVTQWHRCVAFGKLAESVQNSVHKGAKVHLEGELQYQDYEKDGIKRTATKIIISDISIVVPYFDSSGNVAFAADENPYANQKPSLLSKNNGPSYASSGMKTDLHDELPF